jgi:hypothetical protein
MKAGSRPHRSGMWICRAAADEPIGTQGGLAGFEPSARAQRVDLTRRNAVLTTRVQSPERPLAALACCLRMIPTLIEDTSQ